MAANTAFGVHSIGAFDFALSFGVIAGGASVRHFGIGGAPDVDALETAVVALTGWAGLGSAGMCVSHALPVIGGLCEDGGSNLLMSTRIRSASHR